VQRFHDAVEEGAKELGYVSLRAEDAAGRSGALCLLPPPRANVIDVFSALQRLGVACALPDGKIRFSPHWPNALDESEQVLLSLREALNA
jgi:hypothetical protein